MMRHSPRPHRGLAIPAILAAALSTKSREASTKTVPGPADAKKTLPGPAAVKKTLPEPADVKKMLQDSQTNRMSALCDGLKSKPGVKFPDACKALPQK